MAMIIALVVGLIVSGVAGFLLQRSVHQKNPKPKMSNVLNGVIAAFIFFCVSFFVYTLLVENPVKQSSQPIIQTQPLSK